MLILIENSFILYFKILTSLLIPLLLHESYSNKFDFIVNLVFKGVI
jgi:hypothetical protein